MTQRDYIIEELVTYLIKLPNLKADAVYFLILIRKLLELDQKEDDYQELIFYCDFALHPNIDRFGHRTRVQQMLQKMHNNEDYSLLTLTTFNSELIRFCTEYNILKTFQESNLDSLNLRRFVSALNDAYNATPIFCNIEGSTRKITVENKGDGLTLISSTVVHFICLGSCKGVSGAAKKCGDAACDRFNKDLESCDCTDSKHFGRQDEKSESQSKKIAE